MNTCVDCSKKIGSRATRCKSCNVIHRYDIRGRKYPKHNYCVDCKKEISLMAARCTSCAAIYRYDIQERKPPDQNYCPDCGIKITKTAVRCIKCSGIARRGTKNVIVKKKKLLHFCLDCNKEISDRATRCRSCAGKKIWTKEHRQAHSKAQSRRMLRLWKEGRYDNREITCKSPTGPEKNLMAVFTELGIEYEFNKFCIDCYTYDFYLPDYNALIEYDGWYWHYSNWAIEQGHFARDRVKDDLAEAAGFNLTRLIGRENNDLTYKELFLGIYSVLEI